MSVPFVPSLRLLLLSALLALSPAWPAWAGDAAGADDEPGDDDEVPPDVGGPAAPARRAPPRREGTAQRVLFVDFAASGSGAQGEAATLSADVLRDLRSRSELDVVVLADVPPVYETSASLYMKGCPEGQDAGCQLVLGEKADADRVVGGRVEVRKDRPRLIVTIINIAESQVEQAYAVDVDREQRDAVIKSVAATLTRLTTAEVEEDDGEDLRGRDAEAQAAQALAQEKAALKGLDPSLGAANFELLDLDRKLTRPSRIRLKDLEGSSDGEFISTPWDDVGLSKRAYVSYRNSGLVLDDWKRRRAGHHLQVLLGGSIGFSFPFASDFGLAYYGHYIRDDLLQNVMDNYAWQSVTSAGFRPRGELTAGFGLLPFLDFEYTLGLVQLPVYRQKEEGKLAQGSTTEADPSYNLKDEFTEDDQDLWPSHTFKLRLYLLGVPRVRPSIALGAGLMVFPDLAANEEANNPNSLYIQFSPYTMTYLDIEPGVLFELGQHIGLYVNFPVNIDINPASARTQALDAGPEYGLLDGAFKNPPHNLDSGLEPVPDPGRVSAFFVVGIQVRPNPVFVMKGRRGSSRDEVIEEN